MSKVQVLPTEYRGVQFRSRTEARWAVFFDALLLPWEYEKEGYSLPSGNYLPDFYLPGIGWFEVKGKVPTERECRLADELSQATVTPTYIAWHGFDVNLDHYGATGLDGGMLLYFNGCEDVDQQWAVCADCLRTGDIKVGITFEARQRMCREHRDDHAHTGAHRVIRQAYAKARGHRFWNP